MPTINLKLQSNGGLPSLSSSSVHTLEGSMGRLTIQIQQDDDSDVVVFPLPYHSGRPDCTFYGGTGDCPYGLRCKFNHIAPRSQEHIIYLGGPERFGEPDCEFYVRKGICRYGPYCKFTHPPEYKLQLNSLDLPIRQGEMSCAFYLQNGRCKYGVVCRYNHPEPATTRASSVNRHTIRGQTRSSAAPLAGRYSAGGVPAESSDSYQHSQSLETSRPLVIYPSQGYTSPTSYEIAHGPAVIYNPNPGALNWSSSVNLFPTSFNHLPERPDLPECWEFMNSGTCKYGSICKYHHPRERKAQTETYIVGPLVLPLRTDQALCSRFNLYGFCKYGLTGGRYDYPSAGYFCNNGLSSASVGGFGQSFLYQKSSPSFHLSEIFSTPAKVTVTVRKPEVAVILDTGTREASKEKSSLTANDQSA